jgi:hypothetical protein
LPVDSGYEHPQSFPGKALAALRQRDVYPLLDGFPHHPRRME